MYTRMQPSKCPRMSAVPAYEQIRKRIQDFHSWKTEGKGSPNFECLENLGDPAFSEITVLGSHGIGKRS